MFSQIVVKVTDVFSDWEVLALCICLICKVVTVSRKEQIRSLGAYLEANALL